LKSAYSFHICQNITDLANFDEIKNGRLTGAIQKHRLAKENGAR